MNNDGFCQRNLKPVFVLLVVLIAATIVWAAVSKGGQAADAPPASQAAKGAPGAGQTATGASDPADAWSLATPKGGVDLVAQPAMGFPPVAAPASARIQLIGARPQSRHAFNTVSSLMLPAVVNILAIRDPRAGPTFGADRDARFADRFGGVPERFAGNRAYESVGSGFIIDSRGYVLTNYHVVSQATDLLVSVCGRINRDFPATVVGADPGADLALIKVRGAPALPEAQLGDSHSVRVGDWVLAFGCPFGLEQTVTQGIISNKLESPLVTGPAYGELLQTDAPTNRGSSGGPLVNLKAEVIGINMAIYGLDGDFSGTGLAIPVDRAKAFLARFGDTLNR